MTLNLVTQRPMVPMFIPLQEIRVSPGNDPPRGSLGRFVNYLVHKEDFFIYDYQFYLHMVDLELSKNNDN